MSIEITQNKDLMLKFKRFYAEYTYLFSFIVLVTIATIVNDRFLTYSNLSTLMLQAAIKGTIALGMTLIIITGQIDLSVGFDMCIGCGIRSSCS